MSNKLRVKIFDLKGCMMRAAYLARLCASNEEQMVVGILGTRINMEEASTSRSKLFSMWRISEGVKLKMEV